MDLLICAALCEAISGFCRKSTLPLFGCSISLYTMDPGRRSGAGMAFSVKVEQAASSECPKAPTYHSNKTGVGIHPLEVWVPH